VYLATSGKQISTIVLFSDVTDIRQVEQVRENLIHMIVHDLRSPISSVHMALLALAGEETEMDKVQQEILSVANRSTQRLIRMIETLLDVARLDAGHMPVEKQVARVEEIVEEAIEQVAPQAEAKGLHVGLKIGPDLMAWADPELLQRVIINLVGNAIKFTPRGGSIVVRAEYEASKALLLSVQDDGPGILLEDQARIFDRFTQTGQRRQWGSGLGLTFCKLAVEAHGGRIWVESTPGKGSTFYLSLPTSAGHLLGSDG